jgi:hypothetical protein
MRIYEDHNGVVTHSIKEGRDGSNVEGHKYTIVSGDYIHNIMFQNGPVKDKGINGITNESMLAILIHRIQFLDAKFSSEYNKVALMHITEALKTLEERTNERKKRGVEGTLQA